MRNIEPEKCGGGGEAGSGGGGGDDGRTVLVGALHIIQNDCPACADCVAANNKDNTIKHNANKRMCDFLSIQTVEA
jgi:polyferredoxin